MQTTLPVRQTTLPASINLTPAEFDILRLVATGAPYPIVSFALGKSVRTITNQLVSLRQKFKARSTLHLCLLAIRYGVLDLDTVLDSIGLTND